VADAAATNYAGAGAMLDPRSAWLTPPALAHLGVRVGDRVKVRARGGDVELLVAGALPALEAGGEAAVIDIAAAQELFGRVGRLSRVDIRLRAGADARAFREAIAAQLPPGVVASEPASISGRAAALT